MKRIAPALLLLATVAVAQQQQPFFESFEVRLHNLEVVVTDAKGNPVRGLMKEDFEVFEDGRLQPLTNFSFFDESQASLVRNGAPAAQEPEPVTPPRRFVFFVDEMALRGDTRRKLLNNALELVDHMRDGDLAAVLRPAGAQRIVQDYTTDKNAIRKALTSSIESATLTNTAPGANEVRELLHAIENASNKDEIQHAKMVYRLRTRARVQQRLSHLRALTGGMAGIEGRKVLVVITNGLSAIPGREAVDFLAQMKAEDEDKIVSGFDAPTQTRSGETVGTTDWGKEHDLGPMIDELARNAAANGVTIYAVEPEVPVSLAMNKTARSRNVGSTMGSRGSIDPRVGVKNGGLFASAADVAPPQMLDELLHYRGQTLTSLTEKTGGKWSRGITAIDDTFRQVASDLSVYYSLAYRAQGERDKPRRVQVRIRNHPEYHARTRSDVIDKSPEREMADLVVANLLFPRNVNELSMNVTTGTPTPARKPRFSVPFDVVIPIDRLTFLQTGDDQYTATVDIHYAASGLENDFTATSRNRRTIEMSAADYEKRGGTTYRFKTSIDVPPGPTLIAVGAMDMTSRLAAFRNVEVNPR